MADKGAGLGGLGKGEVVVVTGGAGFVGQHIVKILLEKGSDTIKEVRSFDIKPFQWIQELEESGHIDDRVALVHVQGSITKPEDVGRACRGATAVIHTAGLVDVRYVPDTDKLKAINVIGTENVVNACLELGIRYLVYTSSVDTVITYQSLPIIAGTEATLKPTPTGLLYGDYAFTKFEAESLVLKANSLDLAQGGKLRSCVLRPTVMYGEGDAHFVTSADQSARQSGGTLYRVGHSSALFQLAYVGNVAWAHLLALKQLIKNDHTFAEPLAGHAYFVADDTPVKNFFDLLAVFLEPCNTPVSWWYIPYWVMKALLVLAGLVRWVLHPLVRIEPPPITEGILTGMCTTVYFSYQGASSSFGYKPLFSYEESVKRSMRFYHRKLLSTSGHN